MAGSFLCPVGSFVQLKVPSLGFNYTQWDRLSNLVRFAERPPKPDQQGETEVVRLNPA
jgi:hypothetical protein